VIVKLEADVGSEKNRTGGKRVVERHNGNLSHLRLAEQTVG